MTKSKLPKHLIAGHYLSSKYVWQKTEVGGREGLFFTVNLVFCLKYSSTQNAGESAHCWRAWSNYQCSGNKQKFPRYSPSFCLLIYCTQLPHAMLSCPSRTLPPALVSHARYLRGSSCTGTSSLHPIQKLLGKCYNAKRNVAIIWHRSGWGWKH